MATMKANGGLVIATMRKGKTEWRLMSNGVILSPRHDGGFRKVANILTGKPGSHKLKPEIAKCTAEEFVAFFRALDGWSIDIPSGCNLANWPQPTKLHKRAYSMHGSGAGRSYVSHRSPGILRNRISNEG